MAPASMPESLATTMQRTPLMKPMPAIMPPPGTDLAGSGVSCMKPARAHKGKKGAPGSSSKATRSRGSNCPRLSNTGLDWAEASAARSCSACHCFRRASAASRRCWATGLCGFQVDSKVIGIPWGSRRGESRQRV